MTEQICQQACKEILNRFDLINKEITEKQIKLFATSEPILCKINQGLMIKPADLAKAISLDCSKDAENAIILYRGSRFTTEPLFEKSIPYCPCFGMSLFAGYVRDKGACAGTRMFCSNDSIVSYAVRVPLAENWQKAFDIPPVNTICGLDAQGELFHARAKCLQPQNDDSHKVSGYWGSLEAEMEQRLVSSLSQEELQSTLNPYFSKRIEFFNRATSQKN